MSDQNTNPADRLLQLFERPGRVVSAVLRIILALGIAMRSFSRLCKRYDVETPYVRRRRRLQAN